jgi:hypothetical protein
MQATNGKGVRSSYPSKSSVHPEMPTAEREFSNIFAARLADDTVPAGSPARSEAQLRSSMKERESSDGSGVLQVGRLHAW